MNNHEGREGGEERATLVEVWECTWCKARHTFKEDAEVCCGE